MAKTVVVLGGAYAGVQVAHRLLKYTLPHVKDLKVILVSKNSHFYWNMASVRAIVPGVLKEEDYAQPIAPGFAKYSTEVFEFITGAAEAVDTTAKTVRVAVGGGGGEGGEEERSISYDYLVVATGTRNAGVADVPWKNNGTHEEITALLAATQEKVRAATHIVVAGAGATGVEAAAELGFEYGNPKDAAAKKEIVLLSADEAVLGGDSIAGSVAAELKKLHVAVRPSARVVSAEPSAEHPGKTEVVLASGEKILTDLYLPTMGMAPNTEFLPDALLTDRKFVAVDAFYAATGGAENVWAAGDVVWKPRGSFVLTDKQAAGVAKNIDAVLRGKAQTPVKTIPIDVLMVATGRSRGAGRMGPVKAFSLMVYLIKGKTLGVERLSSWVDGTSF
ncbi:putative amid-like mitochondrial oxidoreductase protein [Rosellinia necatrix]|uniref:Putative amid-like mitochondrial oxidoreductase protein n=1 Tax=Rosellinia necatrix TaxID=77044 RepID=A0A1S7UIR3_ROSNE|nr:putative amid-like mitochondrial oxidoreductase protein [Rosellinia necatrix]